MDEKPTLKGFLKGFLGLAGSQSKTAEPIPPQAPAVNPAPPPPTPPKPPKPRSEAYLNRRKGRKEHKSTLGYLEVICPYLVSKGEVSPGQMARDLGLPKSTLIYNLNNLLNYCQNPNLGYWANRLAEYVLIKLLKGHRVVRVGAGKYVRYKLVPIEQCESNGLEPVSTDLAAEALAQKGASARAGEIKTDSKT
jgi:hypothetical protein